MSYCLNERKLDYYIPVNIHTALLSSHRGCSKDKNFVLRPSTKLSLQNYPYCYSDNSDAISAIIFISSYSNDELSP